MAQGSFTTRTLEVATSFVNETDGTWLMADSDRDSIPDLFFIKTTNTSNGHVEVHVASGKSQYQTRTLEVATGFANETDGTWLMADWDRDGIPDLVFIKTNNTANGHVEVHIASGASRYQTRTLEIATSFANETDGTWLMADWDRDGIPDLVFIKTNNTANGHVEVHIASGASRYQTRTLEIATAFANETDGTWLMADWDRDGFPDLVFVKTNNTPNGHVEVHVSNGAGTTIGVVVTPPPPTTIHGFGAFAMENDTGDDTLTVWLVDLNTGAYGGNILDPGEDSTQWMLQDLHKYWYSAVSHAAVEEHNTAFGDNVDPNDFSTSQTINYVKVNGNTIGDPKGPFQLVRVY